MLVCFGESIGWLCIFWYLKRIKFQSLMSQKTYEDEALDHILSLQDKKTLSKFIIYFFYCAD